MNRNANGGLRIALWASGMRATVLTGVYNLWLYGVTYPKGLMLSSVITLQLESEFPQAGAGVSMIEED